MKKSQPTQQGAPEQKLPVRGVPHWAEMARGPSGPTMFSYLLGAAQEARGLDWKAATELFLLLRAAILSCYLVYGL